MADPTIPKRWEKILKSLTEWCSGAESMSTEKLEREVLKFQGVVADLDHAMSNDAKLIAVAEELKDLRKDYKEEMSEAQAKSAFCVYLLRTRGSKVPSKTDGN